MTKVLPLNYDTPFKKAFGKVDVFCAFAQDILGITLNISEVIPDRQFPKKIGRIGVKYDLFAEDKQQRIIVEMQNIRRGEFWDRFYYYHLIGIVEQVANSETYNCPRTVYSIVLHTGVPQDKELRFSMGTIDITALTEFATRVPLFPHKLIFLNPNSINEQTPSKVKEWLELIGDSFDGEIEESTYTQPVFQKIIQNIKENTFSPQELEKIRDENDWAAALVGAEAKGVKEGVKEGIIKAKQQMAVNMLNEGIELTLIAKLTGLTPQEINFGEKIWRSRPF
jgi:predicted transposase/invertase (TIGR01784 family)